jgi:hypothetical protein
MQENKAPVNAPSKNRDNHPAADRVTIHPSLSNRFVPDAFTSASSKSIFIEEKSYGKSDY